MKKVTIVVPTKNSSSTLEKTLKSIEEQTYKAIELVVVDNFSDDNTVELARKYTEHVFQIGPERSTQRNRAAEKGTGDYVVFIDSDMVLEKSVIEECVERMAEGVAGVIIPETSYGKTFLGKVKMVERACYVGDPYIEASRFFRRKDFIRVGGYNEELIGNEDWTLHNEMEKLGKIERIFSFIHHNEGELTLRRSTGKKSYYSQSFNKYQSLYPEKAKYQFSPAYRIRTFLRGWRLGFKYPILYVSVYLVKVLEYCAYKFAPEKDVNKVYK